MIGIVAVSHSPALAAAAIALARQVGGADAPAVRIAAGTPDGGIGTDAAAIAAAIDEAATGDGVLVLMDLGSAVLSAEVARELVTTGDRIVLSDAPFVEGLVSAVVLAAAGAGLDAAAAEASGAYAAKRTHLGSPEADPSAGAADAASVAPELSFDAVVTDPAGLHARPAAAFVRAAGRHDARVRVADLDAGTPPVPGDSLLALMALGVDAGTRVRVSASGPDARAALDELRALVEGGPGAG